MARYKRKFRGNGTEAERKIEELKALAEAAEKQASECEKKAKLAEQRVVELEAELEHARQRVERLERTRNEERRESREAVDQSAASNGVSSQSGVSWAIEREEIKFTGRELGRGSWSVVRAAMFRGLPVAAKCLQGTIISTYNREMFVGEMSIAARFAIPTFCSSSELRSRASLSSLHS